MNDAAAEMLAKEMQAIVAADRWKGRDLSAAPPEKWSHLRPETQQFWIDTATRILAALPAASSEDVRAGALKEAAAICDDLAVGYAKHKGAPMALADAKRDILALIPGAKPAPDARSANRVSYNDDGTLDEIVTDAGVHLWDLGGNRWFLGAARSDGTEILVWFRGKVTLIEDDAQEAKP